MKTITKDGPTPEAVREHATQTIDLPHIALIGTFGTRLAPGALIRIGNRVSRVTPGDSLKGRDVIAIDDGRVVLQKSGKTEVLKMH